MAAGRAGKFGFVVGVDRVGQADELRAHGADVVVKDLRWSSCMWYAVMCWAGSRDRAG